MQVEFGRVKDGKPFEYAGAKYIKIDDEWAMYKDNYDDHPEVEFDPDTMVRIKRRSLTEA